MYLCRITTGEYLSKVLEITAVLPSLKISVFDLGMKMLIPFPSDNSEI